ncbi:hypothetical protein [Euryhalocaulis caribicus]|uniref:hypothetical protein n=1 Tax=Euryhalocaulis caribicus TaxID=1161401 RepID=UPI0003A154FB|nr:hypothetical protein [Euryhalocaulis caribicus]
MSGWVQGMFWMARGLGEPGVVSEASVKLVGARIGDACNEQGEGMRALSKGALAEDTGLSEAQVQRAVSRLRAIGVVRAVSGGGGGRGVAPTYAISLDALSDFIDVDKLPQRLVQRLRKGAQSAPLSEPKRGAAETQKGCSRDPKGVQQRPPLQNTGTTGARADAGALPREAEALRRAAVDIHNEDWAVSWIDGLVFEGTGADGAWHFTAPRRFQASELGVKEAWRLSERVGTQVRFHFLDDWPGLRGRVLGETETKQQSAGGR